MTLPDVTVSITDGALGLSAGALEGLHAKIGVSSTGTANTVYSFGDQTTAKNTLGAGPLVEDTAFHLAVAGGPMLAVPVAASNVGTVGTITRVGTSPNPGLTTSGTPRDKYDVIALMVAGGVVGTASFKISFDGGVTYSPVYATAASIATFVAATGLTLAWTAGTYVAGDSYTFSTVAPTYSASDLNTALDALLADTREVEYVHVVGTVGGADDSTKITNFVALASAVATKMATAEAAKRWQFAILEKPETAEGAFEASATWAAFASRYVVAVGGRITIQSQVSGRQTSRSLAAALTPRTSLTPVQEHPGKVARGPLPGVLAMSRDERSTPGLDTARITSGRTFSGTNGFYITNGKTAAANGSDYADLPNLRVINKACRVANAALLRWVNDTVRVDKVTGKILEVEAKAIEAFVNALLFAALVSPKSASGVDIVVNREANILSTKTMPVSVRITPVGYASFIPVDIGLVNPALQVV